MEFKYKFFNSRDIIESKYIFQLWDIEVLELKELLESGQLLAYGQWNGKNRYFLYDSENGDFTHEIVHGGSDPFFLDYSIIWREKLTFNYREPYMGYDRHDTFYIYYSIDSEYKKIIEAGKSSEKIPTEFEKIWFATKENLAKLELKFPDYRRPLPDDATIELRDLATEIDNIKASLQAGGAVSDDASDMSEANVAVSDDQVKALMAENEKLKAENAWLKDMFNCDAAQDVKKISYKTWLKLVYALARDTKKQVSLRLLEGNAQATSEAVEACGLTFLDSIKDKDGKVTQVKVDRGPIGTIIRALKAYFPI